MGDGGIVDGGDDVEVSLLAAEVEPSRESGGGVRVQSRPKSPPGPEKMGVPAGGEGEAEGESSVSPEGTLRGGERRVQRWVAQRHVHKGGGEVVWVHDAMAFLCSAKWCVCLAIQIMHGTDGMLCGWA